MSDKLKLWHEHPSWEEAEEAWEESSRKAAAEKPLKGLKQLPSMVGITPDTAKGLKWKSLKWMILKDHDRKILKGFLKHPFKYGLSLIRSLFKKKSFVRDKDFFFYGISHLKQFKSYLNHSNTIIIVGFSYCHKPFECPSGRFTSECQNSLTDPICRQCFIGKMLHALPKERTERFIIPTIHYIGAKIFDLIEKYPDKELLFIITACEMTLQMFGDWGNMVGLKGIGVRLDGRICNTMKAFELSETGIKPGLTVVTESTQQQLLSIVREISHV